MTFSQFEYPIVNDGQVRQGTVKEGKLHVFSGENEAKPEVKISLAIHTKVKSHSH